MSKDDDEYVPVYLETRELPDGTRVTIPHGPACAKTQAAVERARTGQGPHPGGTHCGPAMVNSEAYKTNYETIFGKRVRAGEA